MDVRTLSEVNRPGPFAALARGSVRLLFIFIIIVFLPALASPLAASLRDAFPESRPADRAAAVALVAGEKPAALGCLTPQIQGLTLSRLGGSPAARRTLALLRGSTYPGIERSAFAADGTRVAFADEPSAFDRVAPADLDDDGTPDVVQRVIAALGRARGLLVERMHLPVPDGLEVVLLELGPELEGYFVTREEGATIVLDGSPATDERAVRNAAIHQYAHAVAHAAGPRMPREWGEALATWATMELDGGPDGVTAGLLSTRLEHLEAGLLSRDMELAAGNAAWLAFLDEAYGRVAVRVTVQELASGGSSAEALERALGRVSDDDLRSAFREFHLWSVLTGPRADRFHFSFAERLTAPRFASTTEGLPALSVQADPAVAPWGAAQVRVVPDDMDGGMGLRFEGEFDALWEVDLLLIDEAGTIRRLALELTGEGWGEGTVPLDGVAEALLLVRNLGSEDGSPHRYTYAAHQERDYPVEISTFGAQDLGDGIDLSWDTTFERDLIAFNLLRMRESGGAETVANPVWIPALGDGGETTSYQFVDRDVEPGVSYVYRVQAITVDGLTSLSEPLVVRRP